MNGVTEVVSLRPGDTLQIQVGSLHGKPSYSEYSHEEILALLARKNKKHVSRASKTPEALAARRIALMARAIRTGAWSTGAPIDVPDVYSKLIELVRDLSDEQLRNISFKAISAINSVLDMHGDQQTSLLRARLEIVFFRSQM